MISSACAISDPPKPDACQDQGGTANAGHPEKEVLLQEYETGERQRRDGYSRCDVSRPLPDAGDDIAGSNDKRNQGSDLPWTDRPQDEKGSGEKCNQRHGQCAVAPTNLVACAAQRRKSCDQSDWRNRAPYRAAVGGKQVIQAIADHPENSP